MTPSDLASLTARVDRISRIVVALQAFEDCETDAEHARAMRTLDDALADPKISAAPRINKNQPRPTTRTLVEQCTGGAAGQL